MAHGKRMKGKGPARLSFKESLGVFKRLFRELGNFKVHAVIIAVTIVIHAVMYAVGTMYLKEILSYIFSSVNSTSSDRFIGLAKMMGVLITLDLISVISLTISSRLTLTLSTSMLCELRIKMFKHMQNLPVSYFDKNVRGDIMSLYTNDTDAIRELLSNGYRDLIHATVIIISVFVSMLVLSPLLTLIVIGSLVLIGVLFVIFTAKTGKYFVRIQECTATVNGYAEEYVSGQKVVKVFCHEDEIIKGFEEKSQELRKVATKGQSYTFMLMPLLGNISYINYAVVAMSGAALAIQGYLGPVAGAIATLTMFLQLSRQVSRPVAIVSQQFNSVMMALAGAKRIFDMLDEPIESDEGYVSLVNCEMECDEIKECAERTGRWAWKHPHKQLGTTTYKSLDGDIVFENVNFSYVEGKPVLRNVNLYAKPGQMIALVGATGAGKTTITNLINRFYEIPEDSKIRYDGINIKKIKKADLRKSMAMVLQDTHLFTGTVRENIRYGKLDATDEEVEKAAEIANATSFISHLPEGFDTMLTADGANLSQGQRPLINIARAAIADPPVLVLDEATSSVDTRTEAVIQQGLAQLMEGKTVFVIAHRLSTVRNANAILVIENGEIIERGTHDDLLAQKGKYYELFTGLYTWE
jgi:ATP-binding cassette subfamily B protein